MLVFAQFVFTLAFMVSFGALLYLSVRGLARLEDEMLAVPERATLWKRLTSSGFLEKVDMFLVHLVHRFLRRIHVLLLRFDNTLTAWLKKTRLKSGEEDILSEFKEMTGLVARSPKEGGILSDIHAEDK